MNVDTTSAAASPPAVQREAERVLALQVMKRRAGGLLVGVTVAFFVITLFGGDATWVAYAQATAEASMVGGLADWFAVTALFRHPLSIPIPHTAIIVERKDQFGETLGSFVQAQFLNPDVLGERVRAAGVAERVVEWVAEPENAARLADQAASLVVRLADVVKDDDVQALVEGEIRKRLETADLSAAAGRLLEVLTSEGRHRDLIDALLRDLDRFLEENADTLRERFGQEAPWWLPGAVDDRIFDRLLRGVRAILNDEGDQADELRARLDAWFEDLAVRLREDPEWKARGERMRREVLDHPQLREWTASVWVELRRTIRDQAETDGSVLRARLADGIAAAGRRLREDPELLSRLDEMAESGARTVAEQFHTQISELISGTVSRWDAEETSYRLELLLGRDLQFIRINGTVVGGLAGLVIHFVSELLG